MWGFTSIHISLKNRASSKFTEWIICSIKDKVRTIQGFTCFTELFATIDRLEWFCSLLIFKVDNVVFQAFSLNFSLNFYQRILCKFGQEWTFKAEKIRNDNWGLLPWKFLFVFTREFFENFLLIFNFFIKFAFILKACFKLWETLIAFSFRRWAGRCVFYHHDVHIFEEPVWSQVIL